MKFGLFVSSSILIGAAFGVHADPPWISYQPQSKTVTLYQPVFLQVIAYGTPPLFYAWRKDGVSLGDLGNTLQFGQPRFSDAGLYSVVISNLEGSITSTEAVLTVNAPRP